ncbi:MAG TPA: NADH:ubiquinone oxidoreductase [Nitrospirae bacterium]|nr:NAD-reducing hydrogenase HoxS subunit delta [bacterium BMS3Abin06]HDH11386.1 NADH:ubiquinone oxidoreductase [Nitrospirota bacterium]HDZ01460.1 NADH:ubiquinone oxidoreductase [Nitrospirota bacterium]
MEAGETGTRTYLGVPLYRPRVAFFEFSSCEGCQLQILNNESTLLDFLSLVEVVNFREAMTARSDDYEIAFVEGSITRDDEVKRLKKIRKKAKVLVALGSCACFGGVNQLKNRFKDLNRVNKEVYGKRPIESGPVRTLEDIVKVDLKIYGCPVKKEEVEKIVLHIAIGKSIVLPKYPVCMECKRNENICLFELGEPCLGPVTRAGCDSWCPNSRAGCWGCRGPADEPNMEQMKKIMEEYGFSEETILDRLECFGGFSSLMGKGNTK